MKNRLELAKYFGELGFKLGAEIGVEKGYYSEVLLQNIPGLKLYCIDWWEGYPGYMDIRRWKTFASIRDIVNKRLAPYNCELIKKYSMDAVKDFADESLDFVYIDANHQYGYVRDDIREWSKKIRKGGIISGHDYYHTRAGNCGVIQAVDEYVRDNNLVLNLTDWDDQNPREDDRQPSWWVQL